ncbi:hypothetical protein GCM10027044_01230 [Hymenobacter ruber]
MASKPEPTTQSYAMSLCVLFGLLFCCLAFFREGVWTKYTPQDVARWQAQGDRGRKDPTPYRPVLARPSVAASDEVPEHTMPSAHAKLMEAPALLKVA